MFEFLRRLFGARAPDLLVGLDPSQTRAIVGLGNPGTEYAQTRHNVGFRCVDVLAQRHAAVWHDRRGELRSLLAVASPEAERHLVLVKPYTFMNHSGAAVQAVLDRLGMASSQCLVVYDDMDLPFGVIRLRERGSPGTHNGMRSVVASLGTENVARLRIGISQASPGQSIAHVLSGFEPEDRQAVEQLVGRAADAALAWAVNGPAVAMNRYNKM